MKDILKKIEQNNDILLTLNNKLINDEFKSIFENRLISEICVKNSVKSLRDLNKLIEAYLTSYDKDIDTLGEQILAVFGLLQSLFVAIDGLYEISHGLTTHKWSVNINKNEILRQIKYIRNDVVGHPNYRLYGTKDVAFITIDLDSITRDSFDYLIHYVVKNDERINRRTVNISKLITNYYDETNDILENIIKRVEAKIPEQEIASLTNIVYVLGLGLSYEKKNTKLLDQIKDTYLSYENLENKYNKDRFLWRLDLIEKCYNYEFTDKRKTEFMKLITYNQIKKLHDMSINFDKIHNLKYKNLKLKGVKPSKKLKDYYTYLRLNSRSLSKYINNLHDKDHPFFDVAIDKILNYKPSHELSVFFMNWLKESKKDDDLVFLIGSLIKQYK